MHYPLGIMNSKFEMSYYPKGTESIINSFRGEFKSCFILFHPFLQIKGENESMDRVSSSQEDYIPDDFKELFKEKNLPSNVAIYSSNPNYPEEDEIIQKGISISWKEILNKSDELVSYEDIQKGLKTSIGAYRRIFQREDLMKSLKELLNENRYWAPKEDEINTTTKLLIFQIFKFLSITRAVNLIYNEEIKPIDLENLDEISFCQSFNSTVVHSLDKEVVFSQDRDTFFCLMLTKTEETMQKIITHFQPEGILCNETTSLPWEFVKEEFQQLLEKEIMEKNKNKREKKKSKGWLRRILRN